MSEIAIHCDGIGKQYRVGARRQSYQTLRETITRAARWPLDVLTGKVQRRGGAEHIWALRDVSFDVKAGDLVGIIGHNGSGKSTLLKILSRVTEPTVGSARIRGHVGSLLEVGTGFHPELTGRENIYLNGAILGMRRAEITRKLDEIVAFAEVERFLDTPVKHYSSGMYLRLAFSVAAHLEPEILLVDEVLAVGDLSFQRKCIAKMNSVAQQGQTVLFVSHNLAMIKEFCRKGILLHQGRLVEQGSMLDCIARYTSGLRDELEESSSDRSYFAALIIDSLTDEIDGAMTNDHELCLHADLVLDAPVRSSCLFCHLDTSSGEKLVQSTLVLEEPSSHMSVGRYRISVKLPCLWLAPDTYVIYLKFIGKTMDGHRIRFQSERLLVNTVASDGLVTSNLNAKMVPRAQWTIGALDLASEVAGPAATGFNTEASAT